ncbi:MAG: YIP1 family protein [Candidatus ainarchaeum sp.]|nr:YIP1 family protein [Candidatus ainarchaeum sp.]
MMSALSSLPSSSQIKYPAITNPSIYFLYSFIGGIISPFIMLSLIYLFAKILGGKGEFIPQAYANTLIHATYMCTSIPMTAIVLISLSISVLCQCALLPLSLVSLLVLLYGYYGVYRVTKEANNLSTLRAAAAVIATYALILIVGMVSAFFLIPLLPK